MPDKTAKLSLPVAIIAVLILIGFAFLFYSMYVNAGTDQAQLWERRMALFGTVEALAFTAAGYLFGKEVHREQAAKAEQRADTKTAEAERAKTEAADANAKGRDLRSLIEAKRRTRAGGGPEHLRPRGEPRGDAPPQGDLAEIADFAERLFP